MKKNTTTSQVIIFIFILPIAVLTCLLLILYTPVDYIRYLCSSHHKEMKKIYGSKAKYTWLATLSYHFRVYELITKNDLPVKYFRDQRVKMCTYGYFFYKGTLLIVDVVPHYDMETKAWCIVREGDASDLQGYIECEKEEFESFANGNAELSCERVIFLVSETELCDEDKANIKASDFILPYNKANFAKRIEEFFNESQLTDSER